MKRMPQDSGSSAKADILFLAYYYPPENAVGGVRPSRMAKFLGRLGHPVRIVARDPEDPRDCGIRTAPPAVLSPVSATGRLRFAGSRLLQRLMPQNDRLNWLAPALRAAGELMRTRKADVVISTFPPAVTHLAALLLKRKHKLLWVADFRDPLYRNPSRRGVVTDFWDRIVEKAIFTEADIVLANTEEAASVWQSRYPWARAKLIVIPNGYDPDEKVEPLSPGDRSCRIISHVGGIYVGRDPSPLLASLERLLDRKELSPSELQVRLIGSLNPASVREPALLDTLSKTGCLHWNNCHVPKELADRETLSADILLLLDSVSGVQVPGKLFEYVRIGRFIVAVTNRNSAVARMLEFSGIPHYCIYPDLPAGDVDGALLRILRAPVARSEPSECFMQEFDSAVQSRRLSEIIQQACGRTSVDVGTFDPSPCR